MSTSKKRLAVATVASVAVVAPLVAPIATAAPGQAGVTNATAGQAGVTNATAPQQVSIPSQPQTASVPQAVTQAAPQVTQAAQPLVSEPQVVYVQGEPVYITQTEYIDRVTVEESGGLWILTDKGRQWVTADRVIKAAGENYQARDQKDKDKLNLTVAAAALGATGGFLIGAGIGTIAGGAGAAAATYGVGTLPILITATTPLGPITATGTTAAAITAGVAGAGAGFVGGGALGAALGAGAAIEASGGTKDAQEYFADIIFTLENGAREDAGFRGLVGDKPSGLPGYREADEGSDTRITEGTLLGGAGDAATAQDAAPAPAPDPAPAPAPLPELPSPYQQVNNFVEGAQTAANDLGTAANNAVDNAQQGFADFVTGANLPGLPV